MSSVVKFGQRYGLNTTELQVLDLILQNLSNADIGRLENRSEQVIKNLTHSIYKKIDIAGRGTNSGRTKLFRMYQEFVDSNGNTKEVKELLKYRREFKEFLNHRTEFLSFIRRKQALQVSMGL